MHFRVHGIGRDVLGVQVRVAADHLRGLPAAELLQREERRAVLHVPTRPGMPEIVPAEVLDAGALHRQIPRAGTHLMDALSFVGEHPSRVHPVPLAQDLHRRAVQGHRDRLARLRLIGMNPRELARQVHLFPGESGHVRRAQSRLQREGRHVAQVRR
jgi:hypothetical protein